MYFAPSLLQNVTGNTQDSLFQSIFLGLALLAGVSIALVAFDRVGRIPLLRWGHWAVLHSCYSPHGPL